MKYVRPKTKMPHLCGQPQLRSTPSEKGATTQAASARVWASWAANCTIRGLSSTKVRRNKLQQMQKLTHYLKCIYKVDHLTYLGKDVVHWR